MDLNGVGLKNKLSCTSAIRVLAVAGAVFLAAPSYAQVSYNDSSSVASMEVRFQQLEKEIRRLTGQVEEQNYKIRSLRKELDSIKGDVSVRFNDLEHGGGVSGTVPAAGQVDIIMPEKSGGAGVNENVLGTIRTPQNIDGTEQPPAIPSDAASHAYGYAYSLVKARNFARAEVEFAKFIKNYPDHSLVSNAKYWYGETFYVRKDYDKAARVFAEGYQQFPKGSKAADNLLKLGMSLGGMGKNEDACVAYKQLKSDYKGSTSPVIKRADTEMGRINCR